MGRIELPSSLAGALPIELHGFRLYISPVSAAADYGRSVSFVARFPFLGELPAAFLCLLRRRIVSFDLRVTTQPIAPMPFA